MVHLSCRLPAGGKRICLCDGEECVSACVMGRSSRVQLTLKGDKLITFFDMTFEYQEAMIASMGSSSWMRKDEEHL